MITYDTRGAPATRENRKGKPTNGLREGKLLNLRMVGGDKRKATEIIYRSIIY